MSFTAKAQPGGGVQATTQVAQHITPPKQQTNTPHLPPNIQNVQQTTNVNITQQQPQTVHNLSTSTTPSVGVVDPTSLINISNLNPQQISTLQHSLMLQQQLQNLQQQLPQNVTNTTAATEPLALTRISVESPTKGQANGNVNLPSTGQAQLQHQIIVTSQQQTVSTTLTTTSTTNAATTTVMSTTTTTTATPNAHINYQMLQQKIPQTIPTTTSNVRPVPKLVPHLEQTSDDASPNLSALGLPPSLLASQQQNKVALTHKNAQSQRSVVQQNSQQSNNNISPSSKVTSTSINMRTQNIVQRSQVTITTIPPKPQLLSPATGITPSSTKSTVPLSTTNKSPMKLATITTPRIKQQNVRKSSTNITKSPASASTATNATAAPPSASASTSNTASSSSSTTTAAATAKIEKVQQQPQIVPPLNINSTPSTPKTPKQAATASSSSSSNMPSGSVTPEDDGRTKRKRVRTIPYQSPIPELVHFLKLTASEANSPKNTDDKLVLFYKNEFLAVRNADGGFFLCQAMHNVYKSSPKIKIRWLSEKGKDDNYKLDFYDITDIECVLTTVELTRMEKEMFKLPKTEHERIQNILKKALDVEKGVLPRPDVTEENPDGLDLSLYKDESQLEKKSQQQKRKGEIIPQKSQRGGKKGRVVSKNKPIGKDKNVIKNEGEENNEDDEEFEDSEDYEDDDDDDDDDDEDYEEKVSSKIKLAKKPLNSPKKETPIVLKSPPKDSKVKKIVPIKPVAIPVIKAKTPVSSTINRNKRQLPVDATASVVTDLPPTKKPVTTPTKTNVKKTPINPKLASKAKSKGSVLQVVNTPTPTSTSTIPKAATIIKQISTPKNTKLTAQAGTSKPGRATRSGRK